MAGNQETIRIDQVAEEQQENSQQGENRTLFESYYFFLLFYMRHKDTNFSVLLIWENKTKTPDYI